MKSYLNKMLMLLCFGLMMPMAQISAAWELPPYQFPAFGSGMDMASDAAANAITVLSNVGDVEAYFFSRATNQWTGPTVLGTTNGRLSLDMHSSGTAIAVWVDTDSLSIRSAFFDGTVWTPGSPDPFAVATGAVRGLEVSMNGPDSALVTWFDLFANIYNSNFFSAGTWDPAIQIGTPPLFTPSSVHYSSNGTAVTTYTAPFGPLLVSNYIGGVWLPQVTLDPALPSSFHNAVSGIDALGRALVVWVNTAGDVQSSTFNGVIWLPPVTISNTAANSPLSTSLSMAPGGTAVAAWVDGAGIGFSNSYNGTAWGTPQQFANPVDPGVATDISVNASGDALLLFQRPGGFQDGTILSARLPFGGVWTSPEFLFTPTDSINKLIASLSDNGSGFAAWPMGGEGFDYFAAVEIVVLPPATINGRTCTNKFASQSEKVNFITWTPSPSANIVFYQVRRNGILVATIPATRPLIYVDNNVCRNIYTYTVTAVDVNGNESDPRSVTLR